MIRLLRRLFAAEDELAVARARVAAAEARMQLLGPIHGTLQTIRGMCTDSQAHEAIDGKLAELDDLVYETAQILGHPL